MKRAFFAFHPAIVLIFIVAVFVAMFSTLSSKIDLWETPLGGHAVTLTKAYLSTESGLLLNRELDARMSVQDAVYSLAAGAPSSCRATGVVPYVTTPPDSATINEQLTALITLDTPIHYAFVFRAPLIVIGVPLQPETVPIANPKGLPAFYYPRAGFTLSYNYQLQQTYTAIEEGYNDMRACLTQSTENGKTLCMGDKVKELSKDGSLVWEVTHKEGEPDYFIDITHNYQFPFCIGKPLTRIKLS